MQPRPLIAVRDVQASSRWYQRLLGCKSDHGSPKYDQLVAPNGNGILQLHHRDPHEHPHMGDPAAKPYGNGVLLWFQIDDFQAAVARARALSAEILEGPQVNPKPNHREIWLRDPDRYVIVLSSWIDSAKWQRYLSKEGCLVCNQTLETRPPTERSIADLSVSRLIADSNTCLKGYCYLVLKPHVIEIYELSDEESAAFMRDVKVASLAIKKVTATVKINYEIHGNTIPHMHMHLYPRQMGDPFENGPVDWRTRTPKLYQDGEFEAFIERMKTAVKEVEQGAAAAAAQRRR